MPSVTVGDQQIAIAHRDDLPARVMSMTGLGVAELAAILTRPTVSFVAVALFASATDTDLTRAAIGELVAASDLLAVASQVRAVLLNEGAEQSDESLTHSDEDEHNG